MTYQSINETSISVIFNEKFFQYPNSKIKHTQPNTQLLESKFADIQNSSYPINNKSPTFLLYFFFTIIIIIVIVVLVKFFSSVSFPLPSSHVLPQPRAHPSFHPRRISLLGNFTPEHAFSRQHDQKHRLFSRYFIFLDIVQGHHPSIVPLPSFISLSSRALIQPSFSPRANHPPHPFSSSLLLSSWINRILEFLFSIRELEWSREREREGGGEREIETSLDRSEWRV